MTRKLFNRSVLGFLLVGLALSASGAWAQAQGGMPTVEVPGDVRSGGLMVMIRWIFGAFIGLTALVISATALINVGTTAIKRFRDYTNDRAEQGYVIQAIAAGVVVLLVVIVLCTMAAGVIPVEINK